jgi:hypothetical protein
MDQFVNGIAPARELGEDGRFGIVDKEGQWLIEPIYENAYGFSDGLATLKRGDTWQFVDSSGTVVLEHDDDFPLASSDWMSSRQCMSCFVTWKRRFAPAGEGLIVFEDDDKYGYMNHAGEIVIPAAYYDAEPFSEGRAAVKLSDESGADYAYIDTTGTVVIPARFERVSPFVSGRSAVDVGYRWAIVDRDGNVVLDSLEEAKRFSEGLAPVAIEQEQLERRFGLSDPMGGPVWGYVNPAGEFVIPPQFRDAGPFSEGLAWVRPLEKPLVPAPPPEEEK